MTGCRRFAAAIVIALLGLSTAAAAQETLRADTGVGTDHPIATAGWPAFAEAVRRESNALRLQPFAGGALTGGEGGLEKLSSGDADMGAVDPARSPTIFPHASLIADLAPFADDPLAAAAAVTEFSLLRCVPCLGSWRDMNLVPLGTYGTPAYVLMSAKPVDAPESLKGQRIWSPGGVWDRWLRQAGALPMAGPAALGRGLRAEVIDGAIDTVLALRAKSVRTAIRGVYALPLGGYRGLMPFVVNGPRWRGLSQPQRAALIAGAPAGLVAITRAYAAEADRALAAGGPAPTTPAATAERTRQVMETELGRIATAADETYGIPDGPEILAGLKALYGKYRGLLKAPNDEAVAVLRREIYAKLDVKTFGMVPPRGDPKASP